jgi:hypothetical protein
MALPDISVSLGGCGVFTTGSPVSISMAVPAGRFWNAYLDLGVYNFSIGMDIVVHCPGGNVTFLTASTVTIGGQPYNRFFLVASGDEAHSINGCAGTTVTVDIEMSSGSGAHSFSDIILTVSPVESLVQCDVWQGMLLATWTEGYDVYVQPHLAPLAYIGTGTLGWETALKIGGQGKGVLGGSPPLSSWVMFAPDGSAYLTPDAALLNFVYKNRLSGTGAVTDWVKTRGSGPYSVDRAALHRYPGRAREHQYGFWCTNLDRSARDRDHLIYCQQGIVTATDYHDDSDWFNLTGSGTFNSYIGTSAAGNVRGKSFGAAWVGDGYGLLFTDDTAGHVYWKWVGDATPVNFSSGSPSDRTPWPADPGVSTGLTGQVCGMACDMAGVCVAILWDRDDAAAGSKTLTAVRTADTSGLNWQSAAISAVPALDVPPFLVSIEGIFFLVYQTTVSPGIYNRPQFVASIDGGATWS